MDEDQAPRPDLRKKPSYFAFPDIQIAIAEQNVDGLFDNRIQARSIAVLDPIAQAGASIFCLALANTMGSYSMVMILPKPLAFMPSAIFIALWPMNVPVSRTTSGLTVTMKDLRKSSTSASAL